MTLRSPPPLETPLTVTRGGVREEAPASLHAGERLIAEARPLPLELALPAPPSFEQATEAGASYPGYVQHPYPECFVCGPGRAEGDGLRLFPGPLQGRTHAACSFRPSAELCDREGELLPRFVWAALDCPSWWGHASFSPQREPILLGRIHACVVARPRAAEACVVLGWSIAREGRRIVCGSALHGERGRVLGYARATWIELKV